HGRDRERSRALAATDRPKRGRDRDRSGGSMRKDWEAVHAGARLHTAPLSSKAAFRWSFPAAEPSSGHGRSRAGRSPVSVSVREGLSRTLDEGGPSPARDDGGSPGSRGPLHALAAPDHRKCGRTPRGYHFFGEMGATPKQPSFGEVAPTS